MATPSGLFKIVRGACDECALERGCSSTGFALTGGDAAALASAAKEIPSFLNEERFGDLGDATLSAVALLVVAVPEAGVVPEAARDVGVADFPLVILEASTAVDLHLEALELPGLLDVGGWVFVAAGVDDEVGTGPLLCLLSVEVT